MMKRRARALLIPTLALAACGDNGAGPTDDGPGIDAASTVDAAPAAPRFRNPVDMSDDALALAALQRLGAPVAGADFRCNQCHSLTNAELRHWVERAYITYDCAGDVDPTDPGQAAAALDCFAAGGKVPAATLTPPNLGLWASGARLPWFEAAHAATGQSFETFVTNAAMPPLDASNALTQGEFDVVAEWVVRGAPLLNELVPPDDAPTSCEPLIDAEVATRVAALATTGWHQVNADAGLAMFGCAGAATPLDCLADEPRATERGYAATWEVAPGQLRILAELPNYGSSFWTRSSADGRFVAHGGGDPGPSTIIDLTDEHRIGVNASYDPTFFPDNSGFIFQGTGGNNTCAQSILLGSPASIDMTADPACSSNGIGLYQHVGRALDGAGEYFASSGNFVSDFGFGGADPYAFFGADDTVDITTLSFDGSTYAQTSVNSLPVPYEGDVVMSTSTKFVMARQGDVSGKQLGFVLHALDATADGDHYDLSAPIVGRYCVSGGKPAFSYDDRYVVYHHTVDGTSDAEAQELGFTGIDDPGFAHYIDTGAINIWLLDLTTGVPRRITNMKPGQYAMFPHFRSDGWIYFVVKQGTSEYVVASDARLR